MSTQVAAEVSFAPTPYGPAGGALLSASVWQAFGAGENGRLQFGVIYDSKPEIYTDTCAGTPQIVPVPGGYEQQVSWSHDCMRERCTVEHAVLR
jgi:hypothetical protein